MRDILAPPPAAARWQQLGFVLVRPVRLIHTNNQLERYVERPRLINSAYIVSVELGGDLCLLSLADGSALTVQRSALQSELGLLQDETN